MGPWLSSKAHCIRKPVFLIPRVKGFVVCIWVATKERRVADCIFRRWILTEKVVVCILYLSFMNGMPLFLKPLPRIFLPGFSKAGFTNETLERQSACKKRKFMPQGSWALGSLAKHMLSQASFFFPRVESGTFYTDSPERLYGNGDGTEVSVVFPDQYQPVLSYKRRTILKPASKQRLLNFKKKNRIRKSVKSIQWKIPKQTIPPIPSNIIDQSANIQSHPFNRMVDVLSHHAAPLK